MRACYRQMLVAVRKGIETIDERLKDVVGRGLDSDDAIVIAEESCRFFKRVITAEKKRKAQCEKHVARRLDRLNGVQTKKPCSK